MEVCHQGIHNLELVSGRDKQVGIAVHGLDPSGADRRAFQRARRKSCRPQSLGPARC